MSEEAPKAEVFGDLRRSSGIFGGLRRCPQVSAGVRRSSEVEVSGGGGAHNGTATASAYSRVLARAPRSVRQRRVAARAPGMGCGPRSGRARGRSTKRKTDRYNCQPHVNPMEFWIWYSEGLQRSRVFEADYRAQSPS